MEAVSYPQSLSLRETRSLLLSEILCCTLDHSFPLLSIFCFHFAVLNFQQVKIPLHHILPSTSRLCLLFAYFPNGINAATFAPLLHQQKVGSKGWKVPHSLTHLYVSSKIILSCLQIFLLKFFFLILVTHFRWLLT